MFWYVLPICKRSFTSSLYMDSCWVYLTLRSLTSLLYVIHVCRGSLTSPLIHCILCFMWLESRHLFSCNACMQGELTLHLSSSWKYIVYISLLLVFPSPLCWWIDKRGRRIWRVYICMLNISIYVYMCCLVYVLHWISIYLLLYMS